MQEQAHSVRLAVIVAVSLCSACGGKNGHVQKPGATIASACVPAGADVLPTRIKLTGSTVSFCLEESTSTHTPYCFAANLETKTIAPTSPPTDASDDGRSHKIFFRPESYPSAADGDSPLSASIHPSADGKGLTACTSGKTTCHDLPIDPASIADKPIAVSEDASLVAIDMRNPQHGGPGRLETWNAATGKKLASFEINYGPTTEGYETPYHILEFLGRTVIAYSASACALPCSSATMYSVRGKYLGKFAADPTAGTDAEHFHDELYVLHSAVPGWPLVVQDATTGKSVELGGDKHGVWHAVVTPERIVRVVVTSPYFDSAPGPQRVEVWGPDLKLVSTIEVPMCATAVSAGSPTLGTLYVGVNDGHVENNQGTVTFYAQVGLPTVEQWISGGAFTCAHLIR